MPDAALIARFRRDVEALAGGAPSGLGLAVSGGPDSLALLLLAHAAWPDRVKAATVDHRLRPDNASEAAFVASVCADLGVSHTILADEDTAIGGASPQAQARALRYRLLADWAEREALPFIATAHHRDDQAETVLMRLARGAGLSGLAGIRASRREGGAILIRPLLRWSRVALAAIVAEAGLAPVDDPSNRSPAYDRTRFRALLADAGALLPAERLAASVSYLAEAETALAWAAEREWQARTRRDGAAILLDPEGLPPALLRRLSARAIGELRGAGAWREDKLETLLDAAGGSGRATLAGVQLSGGAVWRFEPAPPRRSG